VLNLTSEAKLNWKELYHRLERYLRWEVLVLCAVLIATILSLLVHLLLTPDPDLGRWLENWLVNFSTAMAGAGVVLYILKAKVTQENVATEDPVTGIPSEHLQENTTYYLEAVEIPAPALEAALIDTLAQLRSTSTPEGRQPILDTLAREKLFEGAALVDFDLERSNLRGARLARTNLTKARLRGANLQGADLRGALLNQAQLIEADLSGADLSEAHLERAFLSGASMRSTKLVKARVLASLWGVNLEGADLEDADLRGCELFRTNLTGANLSGVRFGEAKINSETVLPDGSLWTPKADVRRFTDPTHPRFWRSDDPLSPAFNPVSHEME
jgi:hypothetical protein